MIFLSHLFWPLLCGLLLSLLFEQTLTPKPAAPWRRPGYTLAIHTGTWMALFYLGLLALGRPWFTTALLLALQLLLVLVNQAKVNSLREAFFFQDFEYFTDAIKHPRLYLPFFGILRTILAVIGFFAAFTLGIMLEDPLTDSLSLFQLGLVCTLFSAGGIILIHLGLKRIPETRFDPNEDLQKLGQISFFWKYWHAERNSTIDVSASPFADNAPKQAHSDLPHLVVIQSESFFDPRPHFNLIKSDVLRHFDRIKSEAAFHGRLHVPAWGANTVRTECGFLSGLPQERMGVHRFNPYRLLARQSIPNLTLTLREMGYRTVCIHPYPASFYQRHKVFPRLGFDQFIDIESFGEYDKSGQYIGDLAVAEKIHTVLQKDGDKPVFLFAITMENHGPLHLEQAHDDERPLFYRQTPPDGCDDLTVYLRHIGNADLMLKRLKETLQACERSTTLCWYGDHVPIMPRVYQLFGNPDGMTDYFIWRSVNHDPTPEPISVQQDIAIHELATLLLRVIVNKDIQKN